MFGISTFAQVPFASLGPNAFALSISEDFSPADDSSQVSAFLQSIAEPITLTDNNSQAAIFVFGLTELKLLFDSDQSVLIL